MVWTTQRRYHDGQGQYWHEDEGYCRRQLHKARVEAAGKVLPGSMVAKRAIAGSAGTAAAAAAGADPAVAAAAAAAAATPGDGSDSPRTVPKTASAAKAHTVMHSPRFSVRKMFQSKSAKAAAAKADRDQQMLDIMHKVSAGEITAADAAVQIKDKHLDPDAKTATAAVAAAGGAAAAAAITGGGGETPAAPAPAATGSYEGAPDRSHLPPSVWLRKKAATIGRDKKRYFVLEGKEFQYFQDSYNGVGVNKKGVIDLKEMTEVTSDGKMIMLVTGEDEIVGGNRRVWMLQADNADVAKIWVGRLKEAQKDPFASGADEKGNFAI